METQQEYKLPEKQSIAASMTTSGGLVPHNLEQLWQLSVIMAKSGLMPKGLASTEAVFVAVQMGLEVGLSPMQAVQNIAVINGRPSVWGDAGLALVEASGKLEDFKETITQDNGTITATCWAKRKGRPTPVERTFTTDDAKNAGLAGKDIWKQYPKRMTQMRARWWVLKDLFPDVLKGLKAAEEVQDYIDVTPKTSALQIEGSAESPATGADPYEVKEAPAQAQDQPKTEPSPPPEAPSKGAEEKAPPEPDSGAVQGKKKGNGKEKEPLRPSEEPDQATKDFLREAAQYKDVLPKDQWEALIHALDEPEKVKPTMRQAFLRTARSRLDRLNQK